MQLPRATIVGFSCLDSSSKRPTADSKAPCKVLSAGGLFRAFAEARLTAHGRSDACSDSDTCTEVYDASDDYGSSDDYDAPMPAVQSDDVGSCGASSAPIPIPLRDARQRARAAARLYFAQRAAARAAQGAAAV